MGGMEEGMKSISWEEEKKRGMQTGEFHPDTKVDEVETLVEKLGPNGAFDELADKLPPDTNPEVVRQMKLVLNQVIKRHQH